MGLLDGFVTGWQNMNVPTERRAHQRGGVSSLELPAGGPAFDRRTIDRSPPPPGFANAQQSGGPARLRSDNMGAGQLSLYFPQRHALDAGAVGNSSFSAARVLQLNVAWPTLTVATQIDYTDNLDHRWPNVAVNARGQTMLSYYRSGTDGFCGSVARRGCGTGAFGQSKIVKPGGSYVGSRSRPTPRRRCIAGATIPASRWIPSRRASDVRHVREQARQQQQERLPVLVRLYVRARCTWTSRTWAREVGHDAASVQHAGRGMNDAFYNNEVVVVSRTYSASGGILSRPVTKIPDGGTVVIVP